MAPQHVAEDQERPDPCSEPHIDSGPSEPEALAVAAALHCLAMPHGLRRRAIMYIRKAPSIENQTRRAAMTMRVRRLYTWVSNNCRHA